MRSVCVKLKAQGFSDAVEGAHQTRRMDCKTLSSQLLCVTRAHTPGNRPACGGAGWRHAI